MAKRLGRSVVLVSLLGASMAAAETSKVLKHDKYPEDINAAVSQMNGQTLQVEPGFVAGEAYGAVYRPGLADYPLQIDGVDLFFAAPPGGSEATTSLTLEFYLDAGPGPTPANTTPDFTINTNDFFYNGDFGVPIKGGQAYQFNFDPTQEDGAPPPLLQGNIIVMVRYNEPGTAMVTEWGTSQCDIYEIAGFNLGCGCQPAGMILDGTPSSKNLTPNSNLLHIVWPVGTCSGAMKWVYFDNVTVGDKKMNGDVIVRLRVTSSDTSCQGDCGSNVCGDDGCGNSCGECAAGLECFGGKCITPCAPACAGKTCGDNGCGGKCGNCAAGLQCTPAGQCQQPCVPNCTNKECGPDGCGATCGLGPCGAGTACDETLGLCIAPCSPNCTGKVCGSDGCGSTCGTCGDNEICTNAFLCAPSVGPCEGQCTGKECGDDGCGKSCGECPAGETCSVGKCEGAADGADATDGTDGADGVDGVQPVLFSVTGISPDEVVEGTEIAVSIRGTGFATGLQIKLGGTTLTGITIDTPSLASATVPATLAAGLYDLIAFDTAGNTSTLARAFEVSARASGGAGGCSATPTADYSVTGTLALLAILFGGALVIRIKRQPRQEKARIRRP